MLPSRLLRHVAGHWLTLCTAFAGVIVGLAVAAPVLASLGAREPAHVLYTWYQLICHQRPERTFFLGEYPLAFCQRDTALFASAAIAGIAHRYWARVAPALTGRAYLLLLVPLALDGTLQGVGLYEGTWPLRVVTGALAGGASVCFFYPRMAHELQRLLRTGSDERGREH